MHAALAAYEGKLTARSHNVGGVESYACRPCACHRSDCRLTSLPVCGHTRLERTIRLDTLSKGWRPRAQRLQARCGHCGCITDGATSACPGGAPRA